MCKKMEQGLVKHRDPLMGAGSLNNMDSGYNTYRGRTQTDYQNKHYNINQKDEGI